MLQTILIYFDKIIKVLSQNNIEKKILKIFIIPSYIYND
jgi:hypothetical protein